MLSEEPIFTHAQAETAFRSDDPYVICSALAAATLTDWDRTWLEKWCVTLSNHEALAVRQMASTCFGHLARRFRRLEPASLDALDRLCHDPGAQTYAQDALEDVRLAAVRE